MPAPTHPKPAEISTHELVQIGRFRSRAHLDATTLRVGVSGTRRFREIHYISREGYNLRCLCHVEERADENWQTTNETRLLPVMRLLAAGAAALAPATPEQPTKGNL